jgi:hypothetical protein
MSQSVDLFTVIVDLAVLLESAAQLAIRKLNERRLQDSQGNVHQVDHVLADEKGNRLGVQVQKDGTVNLIPQKCGDKDTLEMAKRLTQQYARTKVINELKNKGYQVVKEEVQPNKSVRVVVQRWQ